MFSNPRYSTGGISEKVPILTQIILWNCIDTMKTERKDYLQVFKLTADNHDVKSETVTRAVEFSKYDAFDSDSIPPFFSVIPSGFIVLSYNGAKGYEYYDGDEIKDTAPLYSTVHYLNFKGDEVAKYDIIKGTINEDMSTEIDSLFSCFGRGYIYTVVTIIHHLCV